jgi:hypothetical protein
VVVRTRAVSTVLDASLCLLLVSASAVTLAGTPTGNSIRAGSNSAIDPDTADRTAELLATSTARVSYPVADDSRRTTHNTLAGLLASATRADVRGTSDEFVRAVIEEINRTLRRHTATEIDVQVIASRVGDGANTGRITAGKSPPPTADVHAARFELRETRLAVRTWSS